MQSYSFFPNTTTFVKEKRLINVGALIGVLSMVKNKALL